LSRYLDQETAKGPFRSLSQAATCYYQSNHSKVETIPLSALPKDRLIFTLSLFYAERQAGNTLPIQKKRSFSAVIAACSNPAL